ncbi:MAG: carboxylesterase family protein [Deltaproteobacteria bacterium]|nr:carboxylesterase family protein [Deltaproteobacteria bacterium]MBW2364390.1 carboxylesterase family protein [Deltaproteobacteria bacterium]
MKRSYFCTIGCLALLFLMFASPAVAFNTVVETEYGTVEGYVDLEFYSLAVVWKSIPYARPPVGALRWKEPLSPLTWPGVLDATNDCEPCTQFGDSGVIGSEDCLYLNVFRPNTEETNLPVYFWIHGGSNKTGDATQYALSYLAQRENIVVVVIQYRMGPFGWFRHPAPTGSIRTRSGNFGTLDHLKALKWVKQNIASFGGDRNNVTVAGESAGAANTMHLLVSPLAKKLFHGVFMQSIGGSVYSPERNAARAHDTLVDLLIADGSAADAEAAEILIGLMSDKEIRTYMEGKTTAEIMAAEQSSSIGPTEDGFVMPIGGWEGAINSGDYNKVPVIVGSNQHEYTLWTFSAGTVTSNDSHWYDLSSLWGYGPYWLYGLDLIMPDQGDKDLYRFTAEMGGLNWRLSRVDNVARWLKTQQDDIYGYFFRWDGITSIPSYYLSAIYQFIFGATHASEIAFFFGSLVDVWTDGGAFNPGMDTLGRQALALAMMDYIGNFCYSKDPNGTGLPVWEEWSSEEGGPKLISLDATDGTLEEPSTSVIDTYMITEELTAASVAAQKQEYYDLLPEDRVSPPYSWRDKF